jgi:hypothetical protein
MTLTPSIRRSAGRVLLFPSIVVLAQLCGCMSEQLRFTARRTVNALPDLQYQQVVDNLAKIASNPGFLPSLAVAGQGSVQVTDRCGDFGIRDIRGPWTVFRQDHDHELESPRASRVE